MTLDLTGSITEFLKSSGAIIAYLVIFLVVFAESGILIGFFLPGDTLLIALGFLASQGLFSLPLLLIITAAGAITGDSVGYTFGRRVGPALFNKEDSRFFKKKNLVRAHEFYEKYGPRTIVLARFIPFARTFAPILAGMGKMNYREFLNYNVFGGIGWVSFVILLGYFLGQVPHADDYILIVVIAVVLISLVPAVIEYRNHRRRTKKV